MRKKPNDYSFIVLKYDAVDTAQLALSVVLKLGKEKVVKLKDAVAITKTEKGKIKLNQTADDSAGKGLLKGSAIGILFGVLFGGAGWLLAGAVTGTAVGLSDKGIKNKIMKSLGKEMTADQSALAVLIEAADWAVLQERMLVHQFNGELVVIELSAEHLHEVDALAAADAVADEIDVSVEMDEG